MASLPPTLERSLSATATLAYAELFNEGKSAANDPEAYPLAQISELLDGRTCALCAAVDGKILDVSTPEYREWRQPSHINCRRTLAYIPKGEAGTEPDFVRPDAKLIKKHGHYHLDPEKHAEFRIPAEPAGRHLIVRRVKHPETGELGTRIDYAPWWEQVPQWKRDLVLKARATPDGDDFQAILSQLGLQDLKQAETLHQATLLGLRDRVEGFLTEVIEPPSGGDDGQPSPSAEYPLLDPRLQGLSEEGRRFWGDSRERRKLLRALRDAYDTGTLEERKAAVAAIDTHVAAGVRALGLERGTVRSVDVEPLQRAKGVKRASCDLRIDPNYLRRSLERRPDGVIRTWVHESMHARAPFQPSLSFEYTAYKGYEEGVVEGLARIITREKAGMLPSYGAYGHYVRSYELLAEQIGTGLETLLRELWKARPGEVRMQLLGAVDRLRQEKGAQPLTPEQRQNIQAVADELFARPSFEPVRGREIRKQWRQAFR
ncbi:MAG: hypothetical protein ACK47B_21775 [Armatimonadota bacterium]